MNLYEVIRWGNDSDDAYTGGPNGPDTCFLVRASSPDEAVALVDPVLAELPHERVQTWSHVVFLLGPDAGTKEKPTIRRGPYVQHAFCYGWRRRQWHRNGSDDPWIEMQPQIADVGVPNDRVICQMMHVRRQPKHLSSHAVSLSERTHHDTFNKACNIVSMYPRRDRHDSNISHGFGARAIAQSQERVRTREPGRLVHRAVRRQESRPGRTRRDGEASRLHQGRLRLARQPCRRPSRKRSSNTRSTASNTSPSGARTTRRSSCSRNTTCTRKSGRRSARPTPRRRKNASRWPPSRLLPLVERTAKMKCKLGLYNHGGWGGEPENLVAVCELLRSCTRRTRRHRLQPAPRPRPHRRLRDGADA